MSMKDRLKKLESQQKESTPKGCKCNPGSYAVILPAEYDNDEERDRLVKNAEVCEKCGVQTGKRIILVEYAGSVVPAPPVELD